MIDGMLRNPRLSRQRIDMAWLPFWSIPDAPIRVEKSPQNLIQSRLLQELFPSASFVMVARHPMTVALATQKWTSMGPLTAPRLMPKLPIRHLVRHWLTAWELFEADRARLEDAMVIRFEDMVTEPTQTLEGILKEIGVDTSVDVNSVGGRPSNYDERYRKWRRTPSGRLAERTWMPELEPTLNRFGYSFDDSLS